MSHSTGTIKCSGLQTTLYCHLQGDTYVTRALKCKPSACDVIIRNQKSDNYNAVHVVMNIMYDLTSTATQELNQTGGMLKHLRTVCTFPMHFLASL